DDTRTQNTPFIVDRVAINRWELTHAAVRFGLRRPGGGTSVDRGAECYVPQVRAGGCIHPAYLICHGGQNHDIVRGPVGKLYPRQDEWLRLHASRIPIHRNNRSSDDSLGLN